MINSNLLRIVNKHNEYLKAVNKTPIVNVKVGFIRKIEGWGFSSESVNSGNSDKMTTDPENASTINTYFSDEKLVQNNLKICRFALLSMCDIYDMWEPDLKCVLNRGVGCEIAVELSKKETSKP